MTRFAHLPRFPLLLSVAFIAILQAGCTGSAPSEPAKSHGDAGSPKAGQRPLKVGIVFDSGGRGDKSFNDSAWAGIERAKKEFGIEVTAVDSKKISDYKENIQGMAERGTDLTFAVGFGQNQALSAVAPEFPDQKFAIIDAEVKAPNVRSLLFSEEQGSFLAGYLAARESKSGKIGFIGGMNIPLIQKFEAGFRAGARYARPDITVLPAKYTDSWDDSGTAKAAALVLYGSGADIIYHAAGRAGLGLFAAAKEKGKYAIGVDSDQDDVEPGVVLTSMVKRVDEAVYQTIRDTVEGNFTAGTKAYNLAANGVGLSEMRHTKDKISPETLAGIADVSERIKKGSLVVPERLEDVDAFLQQAKR